jgi:hypothetical protein
VLACAYVHLNLNDASDAPSRSTAASTLSPGTKGPTPSGVPVLIMSPTSSVIMEEMNSINFGTCVSHQPADQPATPRNTVASRGSYY